MGSQNPLQTGDNITYDKLYYFYSENRFRISLENFVGGLEVFELKVYSISCKLCKIIELSQLFYPCFDDVLLVPVLFSSLGNEKLAATILLPAAGKIHFQVRPQNRAICIEMHTSIHTCLMRYAFSLYFNSVTTVYCSK